MLPLAPHSSRWSTGSGSNTRPVAYQATALPLSYPWIWRSPRPSPRETDSLPQRARRRMLPGPSVNMVLLDRAYAAAPVRVVNPDSINPRDRNLEWAGRPWTTGGGQLEIDSRRDLQRGPKLCRQLGRSDGVNHSIGSSSPLVSGPPQPNCGPGPVNSCFRRSGRWTGSRSRTSSMWYWTLEGYCQP